MAPGVIDQLLRRCESCLGMGYKGRWRRRARGAAPKVWRIESCSRCGGRGEVPAKVARRAAKGGQ